METRVRIKFPVYSLVRLAARRVIVKPMANGECYVVLFTNRTAAEMWRSRECPHADLWTISTRDHLRKFLEGAVSNRTCRVCINPTVSDNGDRRTLSIRGLAEELKKRRTRQKRANE